MTQHIGIVAGSAEGAALCYRTICLEAPAVMGEHNHPEITMNSVPMAELMPPILANDWETVAGDSGSISAQGREGRGRLRHLP